jgi:hypothetical protein
MNAKFVACSVSMVLGFMIAIVAGHAILTFPASFYTDAGSTVGSAVGRYYVSYFLFGASLFCGGLAFMSRWSSKKS